MKSRINKEWKEERKIKFKKIRRKKFHIMLNNQLIGKVKEFINGQGSKVDSDPRRNNNPTGGARKSIDFLFFYIKLTPSIGLENPTLIWS